MTTTTTTAPVALTTEAAESITEAIRKAGANVATARKALAKAIAEAKAGDVATVLGFASWTAYVAHVFSEEAMPRMGKADREYLAGFMAGEGMSSRAVASVLGVSQATASRMIRATRPEGEDTYTVAGTDGKAYTVAVKAKADPKASRESGEGEGESEDDGNETPTPKADPITSGLAKMRKGARLLTEADTSAMTVAEIDAALAALAEISGDFKRFAASLALSRESAAVDAE
jgi:hypothetical protein